VIAGLAARQHGVIRLAQLLAAGLDPRAITRRVKDGRLVRIHRGVYALHRGLSREGRWLAAVFAAGEGAALSHLCAAALRGLRELRTDFVTVVAPKHRAPKGPIRVHECRNLDPRDVTIYKGIPVTTVARMLVDLTDVLTRHQLANVIHEAEFKGLFNAAHTREAIERARGRHKLGVLEQALELHASGSAGTKSPREDAFLALAGEPVPLTNTMLLGEEVDFLWPEIRLNIEVDGAHHRRKRTKRDDDRRDAKLRAAGYTVIRFTGREVQERPQLVRAKLEAARRRLGG
jgi:hypothetical protein